MNLPLNPHLLTATREAYNKYTALEDQITGRMDYIINTVLALYGSKLHYWYFYGAGEGEIGPMLNHIDDESFRVIIDYYTRPQKFDITSVVIIMKDGSEWGFEDGFPTRWLFENFEQELIEGKKKYENEVVAKAEARKAKQKLQAEKKKNLIKSAKSKLSREELRALKGL